MLTIFQTWFFLNDFSMVLATICTALALHLGLGPGKLCH